MISSAISSIVQELDQFLRVKFQLKESGAILSKLVNMDGSVSSQESNKILVSLVSIQEDKISQQKFRAGKNLSQTPPVFLNVFILVSANFEEKLTKEALKFISAAVAFFQSKRVFDPSNTPSLDNNIERLILEIENLDFDELSKVFSLLGIKYLPSVLYKIRLLSIDEEKMEYVAGPVSEMGFDNSPE